MRNRAVCRLAPLLWLGSVACALPAGPAAARDPEATIEAIEVRLVYQRTPGRLSKNIVTGFTAWNTIIGEGDAEEPADDLLVSVKLSFPEEEGNSEGPLRVEVSDAKGKVLASRRYGALFFSRKRTVETLLVPNATCAGRLKVTARLGKQVKTAEVALMCGE